MRVSLASSAGYTRTGMYLVSSESSEGIDADAINDASFGREFDTREDSFAKGSALLERLRERRS